MYLLRRYCGLSAREVDNMPLWELNALLDGIADELKAERG